MHKTLLALALAATLTGAAAAADETPITAEVREARAQLREARNELRALTRRIADLSARVGGEDASRSFAFRYLSDPDRAMIGVVLDQESGDVVLAAVTPGGPAEKAGLRAGDRVVAIGGRSFDREARDTPGEVVRGLGRVDQAREAIGELKVGDKVTLTIERDGKRRTIEVAAEQRKSWDWPMLAGSMVDLEELKALGSMPALAAGAHIDMPNIEVIVNGVRTDALEAAKLAQLGHLDADRMRRDIGREMRRVMVFRGGELYDLKLAPLNPELGRYFGTDSGVLVLDKGDDLLQAVRPGDVIVSIDGKRVESTTAAMRALADNEPGSAVNVEVMRDRKRQVVVVNVPERQQMDLLMPAPPTPPAPPAPPAAPAPHARVAPAPGAAPAAPATPRPAPRAHAPAPPAPPRAPEPPTPPPGHDVL